MRRCGAIGLLLLIIGAFAISPLGHASSSPAPDPTYAQDNWFGFPTGAPPEVVAVPTTRYYGRENLAAADNVTLGPDYAENNAESSTTTLSPTYENKVTLLFTPSTPGNYLVLATAILGHDNTASWIHARLLKDPGGEVYSEVQHRPFAAAQRFSFATHKVAYLSAGATYTIQYRTTVTTTAGARIENARITVMRVIDFYTVENNVGGSTTSTTYEDVATFSPTLAAGSYLVIATANFTGSSTADNTSIRVYDETGAIVLGEGVREPRYAYENYTFAFMEALTLPAGPRTLKLQFKSSATAATALISNARLSVIRLDSLASYWYENVDAVEWDNTATLKTKVTLDLPAPFADNYLVLASALVRRDWGNRRVDVRLVVDEVVQDNKAYYAKDGTDYVSYFTSKRMYLGAGSHTLKLEWVAVTPDVKGG